MTLTRWLLAFLVVGAGCTATVEASSSTTSVTTTTESVTTTTTATRPVAVTINLGGRSGDVDYCLDNEGRLAVAADYLGVSGIPNRTDEHLAWAKAWAVEQPDEFQAACAFVHLRFEASDVSDRIWAVYGDEAMAVVEQDLADTERVWCFEHGEDVTSAADILQIGLVDHLPEQLGVPRLEYYLGDDLFGAWVALNPDDYVRSCRAAFGAR